MVHGNGHSNQTAGAGGAQCNIRAVQVQMIRGPRRNTWSEHGMMRFEEVTSVNGLIHYKRRSDGEKQYS